MAPGLRYKSELVIQVSYVVASKGLNMKIGHLDEFCKSDAPVERWCHQRRRLTLWGVVAIFLCVGVARGDMGSANVFAGRKNVVLREVQNAAEGDTLEFRVAREHRALASGTVVVKETGVVTLPVALPDVKPGIAMQLELSISKPVDGTSVPLASGKVWAFSEMPFAGGADPAGTRRLYLYDPAGKTAEALEAIKLRIQCVDDFSALESVTNAFIVIHEGFSADSVRDFDERLAGFVRRANRVLLIAPSEGAFAIPEGLDDCWYGGASKGLHRPSEILGTDYDLDLSGINGCRFRLGCSREAVVLEVDAAKGHEAVIWTDSKTGGKVLFCGLGLISNWEKTPAARWLLTEILLFE